MKPIVIVGAGGHGKVVLDICLCLKREVVGFVDSQHPAGTQIHKIAILGGNALLDDLAFLAANDFVVAIGDQKARRELSEKILQGSGTLATLIHPSAQISAFATIGAGSVVVAGAIINIDAKIGRYCIVNTGATIDHDVWLEDGVQICPGANLAGGVHCESGVFIGTGAVIAPKARVGKNSVIGAGAVVLENIPANILAVGNPAYIERSL